MSALAASLCFWALLVGSAADLGDTSENDFTCPPTDSALASKAQRVPVEGEFFLPVLSSKNPNSRVHLALIVLHGSSRNAEEYYTNMVTVTTEADCGGFGVAVVAPAIPAVKEGSECTGSDWGSGGASTDKALTWTGTKEWALGQQDDQNQVSSFRALDKVVEWCISSWWRSLRAIVVTGFSTGAQLALRWAILSPQGENGKTSTPKPNGGATVPMRMIVASPSTVTYLNKTRPDENCTEEETTTSDFRCSSFSLPEAGSRRRGRFVQRTCESSWDDWQYGLSNMEEAASRQEDTAAKDAWNYIVGTQFTDTTAALVARFGTKDIRFLVGTEDTRPCGEGSCASSCSAMVMGSNRKQRLLNYMVHLEEVFGSLPSFGVFTGQHEHLLAFRSDEFLAWGFPGLIDPTTGECDVETQTSTDGATSLKLPLLLAALLSLGVVLPLTHQLSP